MQAISTKYIGPSNVRGSRIKATCDAGSITIPYPHELSGEDVHKAAALALIAKLGWGDYGRIIGGGTKDGYVFVFDMDSGKLETALGHLCQHVAGNRGNRSGNPYCVPEMKDALMALNEYATGRYSSEYSVYCNAADKFKK